MLPNYVEIGDRLYEVKVVSGPLLFGDAYARSLVIEDDQAILISDFVPEDEHPALLEKAVSAALGLGPQRFRCVPLVGSIS